MDKSTQKRNKYNTEVVDVLVEEYQVSKTFVRQAIRGDKTSLTAETIKKKYYTMANATKRAITEFKNNLKTQ